MKHVKVRQEMHAEYWSGNLTEGTTRKVVVDGGIIKIRVNV
jgi:hypothetical protein